MLKLTRSLDIQLYSVSSVHGDDHLRERAENLTSLNSRYRAHFHGPMEKFSSPELFSYLLPSVNNNNLAGFPLRNPMEFSIPFTSIDTLRDRRLWNQMLFVSLVSFLEWLT